MIASTRVSDFVWLRGQTDPPRLSHAADAARLLADAVGQFALHQIGEDGTHLLARDRLGVNKLFVAILDGEVHSSNYLIDLVRQGIPASDIVSIPAGHIASISADTRRVDVARHGLLVFNDGPGPAPRSVAERIHGALVRAFARIRECIGRRPLYVTLSGGLDSTVIAVMAREWLGEFTAVTFGLERDGLAMSEDVEHASRVAAALGVPWRLVRAGADELVAQLDDVLLYGQDWRDFNVHCGVVNAAIARALAADGASFPARPVVLTGDVMNELMADYTSVTYGGREYYALPRVPQGQLRRFLVQGLDAGDREVGIFTHFGVDVVQPYAWCAEAYAEVPADWLERPDAKSELVRQVMGSWVPRHVYERKKVRAQAGSADNAHGTLAVFAEHGLDSQALRHRFAQLIHLPERDLPRLVRAGVYRPLPITRPLAG